LISSLKRRDVLAGGALCLAAAPAFAQQPAPAPPPAPAADLGKAVRVNMQTGEGLIVIDLYVDKAPITTANFLRLVDQRRLDKTTFYRASRTEGAPQTGVIQGGVVFDPARPVRPIAHEPTSKTGILHKDGTISMGRLAPGTATSDFFITVGDSAYLDADLNAPGDNLGYAAFGRVVEGMDVVKKILALPTNGKATNPAMQGQMLSPPVPIVTTRRAPVPAG
jgi:peptidyl-prolyl cis-trans isomerase A (cyclophilin A)